MNTTLPIYFGTRHPIRRAATGVAAAAAAATLFSAPAALAAQEPDQVSITATPSKNATPEPTVEELQKQLDDLQKEITQLQEHCDTNMTKMQEPCKKAIKLAEATAKKLEDVPGHQKEKEALKNALKEAKHQDSSADVWLITGLLFAAGLALATIAARGIGGNSMLAG